jgi:hypothetical protein
MKLLKLALPALLVALATLVALYPRESFAMG